MSHDRSPAACRFGIAGGWLTIAGIVASGPTGLLGVHFVHPPPPWTSAEALARQFHPVQTIPFFGGFALILGWVMASSPIISTFSLQNPRSLAWAIEMWGYACLGSATWFAAVVFDQTPIERAVSRLMVANGVTSLAAGVVTSVRLEWVMTTPGLVAYVLWNVLVLALSSLLIVAFRARNAAIAGESEIRSDAGASWVAGRANSRREPLAEVSKAATPR